MQFGSSLCYNDCISHQIGQVFLPHKHNGGNDLHICPAVIVVFVFYVVSILVTPPPNVISHCFRLFLSLRGLCKKKKGGGNVCFSNIDLYLTERRKPYAGGGVNLQYEGEHSFSLNQ